MAQVRGFLSRAGEPQTATEVATGLASSLTETQAALEDLARNGWVVYKEVGGSTEGSCTRLYWHGNTEARSAVTAKSPPSTKSTQPSATPSQPAASPSRPSIKSAMSSSAQLPSATLLSGVSPLQQLETSISSPSGIQSSSKRSRRPFKSPANVSRSKLLCSTTPLSSRKAAGKTRDVAEEVAKLREKLEKVEQEMGALKEDYSEEELQAHIDKLHEYNEMKDMGQLLLGKIAEVEGTTTAALYEQFGLELDD